MEKINKIVVYSNGICCCSVCVPRKFEKQDIEDLVNLKNPTGIESKWRISKENFKDGTKNPCDCNVESCKRHFLLTC